MLFEENLTISINFQKVDNNAFSLIINNKQHFSKMINDLEKELLKREKEDKNYPFIRVFIDWKNLNYNTNELSKINKFSKVGRKINFQLIEYNKEEPIEMRLFP